MIKFKDNESIANNISISELKKENNMIKQKYEETISSNNEIIDNLKNKLENNLSHISTLK